MPRGRSSTHRSHSKLTRKARADSTTAPTAPRVEEVEDFSRAFPASHWGPPSPDASGSWVEELWQVLLRGHELAGVIALIRAEAAKIRSDPDGSDHEKKSIKPLMQRVRPQLEYMRVHVIRAMTLHGAHPAILTAAYAKPFCDSMADWYEAVVRGSSEGRVGSLFWEATRRENELGELLTAMEPVKAARIEKARATLGEFDPRAVQRVREARLRIGDKGKIDAIHRASRPMHKSTFCRILKLLKEESGQG